jgi:hypothetical protein
MRRLHRATLVMACLVAGIPLAVLACGSATTGANNIGPATGALIPVVAGTWRGAIESRNASGADTGWSGTVYIRVDQASGGGLTGEVKLCDMLVFGDKGPEYYPLTGTADQSHHVRLNLSLYRLEGPYDPANMRLTGTVSQDEITGPASVPATAVFIPVSASEYTAACPHFPTSTPPASS